MLAHPCPILAEILAKEKNMPYEREKPVYMPPPMLVEFLEQMRVCAGCQRVFIDPMVWRAHDCKMFARMRHRYAQELGHSLWAETFGSPDCDEYKKVMGQRAPFDQIKNVFFATEGMWIFNTPEKAIEFFPTVMPPNVRIQTYWIASISAQERAASPTHIERP